MAYNGKDYSGYQIVAGMTVGYCIEQYNKSACLAQSDACMASIGYGEVIDAKSKWKGSPTYSRKVPGSPDWTAEQIRQKAYEELTNGRPVIVRVYSERGHSVTVVGIREGANPNALTDADFLIFDPGDGTIKSLADRTKNPNDPSTCLYPANDGAGMRVLDSSIFPNYYSS